MKLHSDTLTIDDIRAAAQFAGVTFDRLEERGSRTRARAFDFLLIGTGRHGTRGSYGDMSPNAPKSATWDEWGVFLGELFRRDSAAVVPNVYEDGEHFRWATGARFDDLKQQHARHRWDYDGDNITRAYSVHSCKCGAIRRQLTRATWADIAS